MSALFEFLDVDINVIGHPDLDEIQTVVQNQWTNWNVQETSFSSFRERVQIEIAQILSNNNPNMHPMADLDHLTRKRYRELLGPRRDMCTICQTNIHGNSYIRQLKCNHIFHVKCIDRWLLTGDARCPNCNCNITKH